MSFRTGGIAAPPLPANEVRRLGDRRRTRRNAVLAGTAALALLAVVVPVAFLANRGDDTVTPSPPVPTATGDAGVARVITYPEPGIEVVDQGDVGKLTGTTAEFKAFIGQLAEKQADDGASCPGAFHGVTVQKYATAGYALGGVSSCGGYVALWALRDAGWQEVAGGQEAFDCDQLRYYDVPASFAGGCYDYKGDFGPATANGLRLGMSPTEVLATGATIRPGDPDQCRTVVPNGLTPEEDRIDAFLSPTLGVVGIGASPGTKTPEGIGLGSTLAEVKAAYPDGALQNGYWVVPLAPGTEYEIGIESSGLVGELMLANGNQDCFG
ncbi:hypothetical protein EFK50_06930 [Nocardioides marmoriginsengisoli]|uniref:Uncharacterized protein n=2 Tax=Nocardioides marmoriginsengisoli TaxID=661483 RepID=A0A3N0CLC6_9ACTN|nr:hypothetical protein EFK50_06930 [Nocardioides marmoriginsengisoli]